MKRARTLLMALTFVTALAGGAVADAGPIGRIKRDIITEEVRDSGGRTWSFTATPAALRRDRPPVLEL